MTKAFVFEYSLAEMAIKDYFAQTEDMKREKEEIMSYALEKYSPIHACRVAYRLQRRHINHIVVSSVLADLPQLHREVIIRKYKKREMSNKIAMELNVSVGKITSIERSVQKNINHMLKYTLTEQDIYSRSKVVNMVHILDIRLSYLEDHPEILPYVNKDWLTSLRICREKYRRLYTAMEEVFQKAATSLHYSIIAERLKNPSLTSKDLSSICHVPQNGINRHLRTYEADMAKYLVA